MAIMSRYSKVYPVDRMRKFPLWSEKIVPHAVADESEVYVVLHEDLAVTAGVFRDVEVIFDSISDDWRTFCATDLQFHIPADVAKMEP